MGLLRSGWAKPVSMVTTFFRRLPSRAEPFFGHLLSTLLTLSVRFRRTRKAGSSGSSSVRAASLSVRSLKSAVRWTRIPLGGVNVRQSDGAGLILRIGAGTTTSALTTGAERRAASSEKFSEADELEEPAHESTLSSSASMSVSSESVAEAEATAASTLFCASNFCHASNPERGGPGGSRRAVTAVQLSARSLFISQ